MKNVLGGRQTRLKMGAIGKKETDRRLPQRGLVKWYHVGALEACVPERWASLVGTRNKTSAEAVPWASRAQVRLQFKLEHGSSS